MGQEATVKIGIIGGSGLEEGLAAAFGDVDFEPVMVETPFGPPSGAVLQGCIAGVPIALLSRHGEGHTLAPSRVPYRANIYALKLLGITHVIASGAVGSLREEIRPGEIVLIDQFIDRTEGRDRTFFSQSAVHVEFAEPTCPIMRRWLLSAAGELGPETKVHSMGTYVCIEGPSFSTRAESHMHRQLGADVVGMTALPEARLAREAEMGYVLLALPTDYDCWRVSDVALHMERDSLLAEIIGNLSRARESCLRLLNVALRSCEALRSSPCPAHRALRQAIWTRPSLVPAEERQRLDALWGRYLA